MTSPRLPDCTGDSASEDCTGENAHGINTLKYGIRVCFHRCVSRVLAILNEGP